MFQNFFLYYLDALIESIDDISQKPSLGNIIFEIQRKSLFSKMLTRPSKPTSSLFACYPLSGANSATILKTQPSSSYIYKKKSLKDRRPKKEAIQKKATMPLPQVLTPFSQKGIERVINARLSISFSYIKDEVQGQYYDERPTTIGSNEPEKPSLLKPACLDQNNENNFQTESAASSKIQILQQFIQDDIRRTNRSQRSQSACFFEDIDQNEQDVLGSLKKIDIRSSSSSQHSSLRDIPYFGTGSKVEITLEQSSDRTSELIKKLESMPTTVDSSLISCQTPSSKDVQRDSCFPKPRVGGIFMKGRKTDTLIIHTNSKQDLEETNLSIVLENNDSMWAKLKKQEDCQVLRK